MFSVNSLYKQTSTYLDFGSNYALTYGSTVIGSNLAGIWLANQTSYLPTYAPGNSRYLWFLNRTTTTGIYSQLPVGGDIYF